MQRGQRLGLFRPRDEFAEQSGRVGRPVRSAGRRRPLDDPVEQPSRGPDGAFRRVARLDGGEDGVTQDAFGQGGEQVTGGARELFECWAAHGVLVVPGPFAVGGDACELFGVAFEFGADQQGGPGQGPVLGAVVVRERLQQRFALGERQRLCRSDQGPWAAFATHRRGADQICPVGGFECGQRAHQCRDGP